MKTLKVFSLIGIALFALSFVVGGATAPPGIDTHVYPALTSGPNCARLFSVQVLA